MHTLHRWVLTWCISGCWSLWGWTAAGWGGRRAAAGRSVGPCRSDAASRTPAKRWPARTGSRTLTVKREQTDVYWKKHLDMKSGWWWRTGFRSVDQSLVAFSLLWTVRLQSMQHSTDINLPFNGEMRSGTIHHPHRRRRGGRGGAGKLVY